MKLSVSLPEDDVRFLDRYARSRGIASRSATVHEAVRLLRTAELGDDYQDAWDDWAASEGAAEWEATVGDGTRS